MLDKTDITLLENIAANPGKPLSLSIKPLFAQIPERTLYFKTSKLEQSGLIETDRKSRKGAALATITPEGQKALRKGRAAEPTDGGPAA